MKFPDRRYLAWGIGLSAVAVLPLFSGFTRWGWEIAEVLGLAATLACLALCGCPVRPRDSAPPVLLSVRRHEALGFIGLAAATLHILVAMGADPTAINSLKLTAPLYQLAGVGAFALLVGITATSLARPRRILWRSHRNFQATHIAFGCFLAALLAAHVVTTDRYSATLSRRILFVAVTAGGIAMLLRYRRRPGASPFESAVVSRYAFGRHSTVVVAAITTTILALSWLLAHGVGTKLREPLLPRAERLPLHFDHGKHTPVNCLTCHHNYADGRGFDACIHCHRSARADLKFGVEARFHDFCLDCHRNPGPGLTSHGPVSGCTACHHSDAQPVDRFGEP